MTPRTFIVKPQKLDNETYFIPFPDDIQDIQEGDMVEILSIEKV